MRNLDNEELKNIEGGIFKLGFAGIGLIIGGISSFIIGVANGLYRPLSCSSKK